MKQGKLKKYLAAVLSAAMVLSCFPTAAIGAESTDAEAIVDEAETAIDDAADVEEALEAEDVEVGGVEEEALEEEDIIEEDVDGDEEEGKAYVSEGKHSFFQRTASTNLLDITGITYQSFKNHNANSNHGITNSVYGDSVLTLSLSKEADIYIEGCQYGSLPSIRTSSGELSFTEAKDTSPDDEDMRKDGEKIWTAEIKGAVGDCAITFTDSSSSYYIHGVSVTYKKDGSSQEEEEEEDTSSYVYNHDEIEVFDLNADELVSVNGITTGINNRITVEGLKGWITTDGTSIGTKPSKEITLNGKTIISYVNEADGKSRLYGTHEKANTAGEKQFTLFGDDTQKFNGSYYINGSYAERDKLQRWMTIMADPGDRVTVYTALNGASDRPVYYLENTAGNSTDIATSKTSDDMKGGVVEPHTFYARDGGNYMLYALGAKLWVARIIIDHSKTATISGNVTFNSNVDTMPEGYKLKFTNDINGAEKEVSVKSDGSYSVKLPSGVGYTYSVSLSGANGYVVEEGGSIDLGTITETKDLDIKIKAVDLVTVSGNITFTGDVSTGRAVNALKDLKLSTTTTEDVIFIPEFDINTTTGAYTAKYEYGVTYTLVVDGIDDYDIQLKNVKHTANGTEEIPFKAKSIYDVEVKSNVSANELSNLNFEFALLDENNDPSDTYVYNFKGTEGIKLRNGQYKITVLSERYTQKPTADAKVNAAKASVTVNFDEAEEAVKWLFTDADFTDALYSTSGEHYYKGLEFQAKKEKDKKHLVAQGGDIVKVPVKKGVSSNIAIKVYYRAALKFENSTAIEMKEGDEGYNTTSKTSTFTYTYDGGNTINDGYVTITMTGTTYFTEIDSGYPIEKDAVDYSEVIEVGKNKTYTTVGAAVDAVRRMNRTASDGKIKPVTISIQPGNYEEMVKIDTPYVTLSNAAGDKASTSLKNKGVDIDDNAVRITFYYGVGYNYYSMGSDYFYDEDALEVNKANGYTKVQNPSGGGTGDMWNSPVWITADHVNAKGIIFENSFNQYVSEMAAKDVIEKQSGAKEPADAPRSGLPVGSVAVQDKAYVERAAAMAVTGDYVFFDNCKFISHQDTLFGHTNKHVAFYNCDVYGGTDYIMGPMVAVFAKCNFVANTESHTSDGKNDTFYITAPQQSSGRGYMMYNCNIISTTPGVDTADTYVSKQGEFGRPWQKGTSEVVFYATNIGATKIPQKTVDKGSKVISVITDAGWNNTLGGTSDFLYEFGTFEKSGVDNSGNRASWVNTYAELEKAVIAGVSDNNLTKSKTIALTDSNIVSTYFGDWDPFEGKDMTIVRGLDSLTTEGTYNFYEVKNATEDKNVTFKTDEAYLNGETVEATLKIAEGYELDKVVINSSNGTVENTVKDNVLTFIMPSSNVTIIATTKKPGSETGAGTGNNDTTVTTSGNGVGEETAAKETVKAAEALSGKTTGNVDVYGSAEDTVSVNQTLKKGKVKEVKINVVEGQLNKVTLNGGVKVAGLSGYTTVSVNSADKKAGKFATKAQKTLTKKDFIVLPKVKSEPVFKAYLTKDKTTIEMTIVNVTFDKQIKKTTLTPAAVSENAVSANAAERLDNKTAYAVSKDGKSITIGTSPATNRFTSGVWTVKKQVITKIGVPQKVEVSKKLSAIVQVNADGTITVAPASEGVKGSIPLTYTLNGKPYKTAVKLK